MGEAPYRAEPSVDRVVKFGPFSLHPDRGALLKGNKPIPVGSRALELLIALTDRAEELITKDELVRRAWPNAIVEESSLRAQIAVLRKVLRDSRADVDYIAAVPGRGYRFVAPISRLARGAPQNRRQQHINNLPVRLTHPIGRDGDISTVKGRFQRYRLTTIVGPGGIGKTTLCLAVADALVASYEDGVCFLDLAPLADPQLLPSVLASALGIASILEHPLPDVVAFLRKKRLLLVFDSCERVIEAASILIETLLKEAQYIHILATGREALRTEGESVYRVLPLETPPELAGLTASEALAFSAVQLFVERAAATAGGYKLIDADAPIVADICRQLDGLALAIELAAGRVEAFGARGIAERLDDRFRLLAGGRRTALLRHQTLIATLDWSYDSLSEFERMVFRRLGIFAGTFTLACAVAIVTDGAIVDAQLPGLLASLIAKSLVTADTHGAVARYRLLDTMRAYALAKLSESGEFDPVARRLAEYLCRILHDAFGEMESLSSAEWLSRHGRHIDNVRVALNWAFSSRGDPTVGTALTVATIPLWFQLSSVDECREGVQRALTSVVPGASRDAQARHVMELYRALGLSRVFTIGLAPQALAAWAKALEIAESLDDTEDQLESLWGLWFCQIGAGEYRAALDTGHRFGALAGTDADLRIAERLIGMPLFCMGDLCGACRHVERMLARRVTPARHLAKAVRFRFDQAVASRVLLAQMLWLQGFPEKATRAAQSGIDEARATNHAISLCDALARGSCSVALFVGDLAGAEESIAALLEHAGRHALGQWEALGRCWKGALLIRQGDIDGGTSVLRVALDKLLEGRLFAPYGAAFLGTLAEGLMCAGQLSGGRAAIDEGLARCEQKEELWCIAELLRIKAEILLREKAGEAAEQHFRQSIEWARRQEALSWELRSATSLARVQRDQGQVAQAATSLAAVYGRFTEGFATTDLRNAQALLAELS